MQITTIALDLVSREHIGDAEDALTDAAIKAGVTDTLTINAFIDLVADELEAGHGDSLIARDLLDTLEAWEDDPEAALTDLSLVAS
ncbi:MAG: hypothetical protein JHD16_00145 [Solirubrobacteraceae bacterium]|nr:hypothetical protein [Solirubrobacteraceae bacterium]